MQVSNVSLIISVSDVASISIVYPKKVNSQLMFSIGMPSCRRAFVSWTSRERLKLPLDFDRAFSRLDKFLKSSSNLKVLHISLTVE